MRNFSAFKWGCKALPLALAALGLLSACASTPREIGSSPVQVQIDSKTVADLPGLAPRLAHYNNKQTLLVLAPADTWGTPRMQTAELQEMVEQCAASGQPVMQLRRAVLKDDNGAVLAAFVLSGRHALTALAEYSGRAVASGKRPAAGVLELEVEPDQFHGRLREEVQLVFQDGEAQIAPDVYASIESMTTTPQEISLGRRTAKANFLYLKLHNRSDQTYTLNGHDTGAMEASANRMLTASSLHGTTLPPGGSMIARLPIELLAVSVEPGYEYRVRLQDYLAGWDGVVGPLVTALVPLRIQIELHGSERGAAMQRGLMTPVMQVQKRYHVERAGCFSK